MNDCDNCNSTQPYCEFPYCTELEDEPTGEITMSDEYIVSNQVECLSCGDKPFSMHRHDYSSCECGKISVDGGQAYLRRVGDLGGFKELSIVLPEHDVMAIVGEVETSMDSGRNPLGVALAAMRALRDRGLLKGFIDEEETEES